MKTAELEARLRQVDPSVRLCSSAVLRRIIMTHHGLTRYGRTVPHNKGLTMARADLERLSDAWKLDLSEAPEHVVLLVAPDRKQCKLAAPELLRVYWRLLFHQRIHLVFEQASLDLADIRARIDGLGQSAFDEVRAVLSEEHMLYEGSDDRAVYEEFVAVWAELRFFAPSVLQYWFPALAGLDSVDRLIARDLNLGDLYEACQPEGAATHNVSNGRSWGDEPNERPKRTLRPERLLSRARWARRRGNHVKSAILTERACAHGADAVEHHAVVREDLGALAAGLVDKTSEQQALAKVLLPLVTAAAAYGRLRVEGRLLHDLRKAGLAAKREVYVLDLVAWFRGWFMAPFVEVEPEQSRGLKRWRQWLRAYVVRPLRLRLPCQRPVRVARHLRKALARLALSSVSGPEKAAIEARLRPLVMAARRTLRQEVVARISTAMDAVALRPQNRPERVARRKLVEELTDTLEKRDFLRMSDVRDAISRSDMRLQDLGLRDLFLGDGLLRLDRRLSHVLAGVYRPGEFYLRWLQRLSALLFGNILGRFLTRFGLLPFGGAFVILEGLKHMIALPAKFMGYDFHPQFVTLWSLGLVGGFFVLLVNVAWFRKRTWQALCAFGRVLRWVCVQGPRWLWRRPWIQRVVFSRPVLLAWRWLLMPGLWTLVLLMCLPPVDFTASGLWLMRAGVLLGVALALNSRLGCSLRAELGDRVARSAYFLKYRMLPGIYESIMRFFKRSVAFIERRLYAVDEWLHEHRGQSLLASFFKPIFGLIWFGITYLVRIYVNLLIEPQVNPIKHFPVVTVSHKMILPFTVELTLAFASLMPFGPVLANTLAAATVVLLPGVFGFLVWEFKENWRLFSKNRPKVLKPVIIGSHGETMLRFMRPGFHSGTLGKLYKRLRRAERRNHRRAAARHHAGLHHVEEDLRRFFEREFFAWLVEIGVCRGDDLSVGRIQLASNRIRIECRIDSHVLWLVFEEQSGRLVVGVAEESWSESLGADEVALTRVLAYVYARAGVDLVREQIAALIGPNTPYDVADEGLVLWLDGAYERAVVYPLAMGNDVLVTEPSGLAPPLKTRDLCFGLNPITWREWVALWERQRPLDLAGRPPIWPKVGRTEGHGVQTLLSDRSGEMGPNLSG